MRVAIYARVSTDGQSVNSQLEALRKVARRRGWQVVKEYTDAGISGAKGRDQRPALDALLKDAVRGEFDLVAAWSVDRLGRSLQHLVNGLSDLQMRCGREVEERRGFIVDFDAVGISRAAVDARGEAVFAVA